MSESKGHDSAHHKEVTPFLPAKFWDKTLKPNCMFSFHLKKHENIYIVLGCDMDLEKFNKSKYKHLYYIFHFIKTYGVVFILEQLSKMIRLPIFFRNNKILTIGLRCWPNKYNIDLFENKKCPTVYYVNGSLKPSCFQKIIKD